MTAKNWYTIEARAAQPAEAGATTVADISIHDIIGEYGANVRDFAEALAACGPVDRINLSIHSPGGSVFEGWGIYNILRSHPAEVHARVEGIAASMASVILMAADHISMPENAWIMIHNPSAYGMESGDLREIAESLPEELLAQADLLDRLKEGIVRAYAGRTGMEESEIATLMDLTTYLSGAECVEAKFADELLPEVRAAACAPTWAAVLPHAPQSIAFEKPDRPGIIDRLLGRATDAQAAQAAIDAVRQQLSTTTAELADARHQLDQLRAELLEARDAHTQETTDLRAAITTYEDAARADRAALETAREALANLTAENDARVGALVAERLATLGVDPGAIPPPAPADLDPPASNLTGRDRLAAIFTAQISAGKKTGI